MDVQLTFPIDLNRRDIEGRTALIWAAVCDDDAAVSKLLARGALPDVEGQRGSPLIWAVAHGNYRNTERP